MALTTYSQLKSAVADWLNRTDLTSAIDYDFLPLAEAEMRRRIRRSTDTATLYVASAAVSPPSDLAEPISLRINSGTVYQDTALQICSPSMLGDVLARWSGTSGRPTHVAYYDSQFHFAPEPDQSYDCTLVYVKQFTPLSGSNPTNTILDEAPDIYLYGCLLQAAAYLEHDERVAMWKAKFDEAIDYYNRQREREEYGGEIKNVRLPRVIG